MSGGHFNLYGGNIADELNGQWEDEEINALFFDLFGCGWYQRPTLFSRREQECEFGPHGGGLFEALDYWLSCDTSEDEYREEVKRFKRKWLHKKTPRNRVEFYQSLFEEHAKEVTERFRKELADYDADTDDE